MATDAVLIGGWVPDLRFPDAVPRHIGSIDVDLAMKLQRDNYSRLVALLRDRGFHQGESGYEFYKQIRLPNGRVYHTRLDLLTSRAHRDHCFPEAESKDAPEAVPGAELAFADNELLPIGQGGELRVAGIMAFIVMKALVMGIRDGRPKDAYDIHFCLENFPDGLEALAELFRPWRGDDLVKKALGVLVKRFRTEEDDGPVADMEHAVGEGRTIRKMQVSMRIQEFVTLVEALPS